VYPLDVDSRRILGRELTESRRVAAAARGPSARNAVGRWLVAAGLRLAPEAAPTLATRAHQTLEPACDGSSGQALAFRP
jgi:hypothetical protein